MSGRCLLILALAALLGSCTRAPDKTVLTLWAMGREGEVIGALVKGFEADNPGIRVRVTALPNNGAHEKLLTGFAGDSLPDMAQMGNTWVPEFEALGALVPLDARIADLGARALDRLIEAIDDPSAPSGEPDHLMPELLVRASSLRAGDAGS